MTSQIPHELQEKTCGFIHVYCILYITVYIYTQSTRDHIPIISNMDGTMWMGLEDHLWWCRKVEVVLFQLFQPMFYFVEAGQNFVVVLLVVLAAVVAVAVVAPKSHLTISHRISPSFLRGGRTFYSRSCCRPKAALPCSKSSCLTCPTGRFSGDGASRPFLEKSIPFKQPTR